MKNIGYSLLLCILCNINGYAQVVINEIFATNVNAHLEKSTLNFACYIELFNKGTAPANIGGFYLSNTASNLTLYRLPWNITIQPNQYYIVYTDELWKNNHSNFRLDADGGKLFFHNREMNLLDSLTYGKQFPDISFGQKPDGSGKWTRLAVATPGTSNNNVQSGTQICPKPKITPNAGFYEGKVDVTILSNMANAQIRYTTNGSEPTINSPLYTGPFSVSANTIVKARNYHSEYLPGSTACNTFLVNQYKSHLPVVSISTNPEYLTNDSIGIYVIGVNGIKGCDLVANYFQEWERPAVFEYFDASGKLQLTQGIDLKIAGKCSRNFEKKSLGLMASSRYGKGSFDYPFFASRPYQEGYRSLMLRNSGNDYNITMFKDALLQELCINQMDVDYQAYQPVAVFLNGEYLSLMNMREKIDKSYPRTRTSLQSDSIIMLEMNAKVIHGSNKSFVAFTDSLKMIDMKTAEGYRFLDRNIDINEFLNYIVVEIYTQNKDWPGNNYKFYKTTRLGSKWRWILTDLDFGFGLRHSPLDSMLNYVTDTVGPFWANLPHSTLLIRKVLENPVTQGMFIQKMETAINTIFSDERVNAKIDSIKNLIAKEMPYHWQKYGGSEEDWNKQIDALRNFNKVRRGYMSWHLKDFFNRYGTHTELSITNTNRDKGIYLFNKIQIQDTLPKQFDSETALELEALPSPGYEFAGWDAKIYKVQKSDLITQGSVWKYYDKNSLPSDWKTPNFDDNSWLEGPAEFGYGDSDEITTISFGGNASKKYITSAFRKKITLSEVGGGVKYNGSILFDDGAVVYINGKEVFRVGMPVGSIAPETFASRDKEDENYFLPFEIPNEFLKPGENVIAVEIHQVNARTPDMSFDFILSCEKREYTGTKTFTSEKITGTFNESMELTANYRNTSAIKDLVFNEVSASNKVFADNKGDYDDWIEIYNGSSTPVDLNKIFIDYKGKTNVYWNMHPAGSYTLQPGSFVVYWADNEINQGPFHLPFKLPGEGEMLKLIQPIGTEKNVLDSFRVVDKFPGLTIGRFPDGKFDWFRMSTTTPGNHNSYQSNSAPEVVRVDSGVQVYPNPAESYFNVIFSTTDKSKNVISLINFDGRIIKSVKADSDLARFDLSDINAGTYIVKISDGSNQVLRKIVVIK